MTKKMRQTFQEWHLAVRLVVYFVGLFIMTLGVSMSVKSNLGVSPVSSIPYTITCVFGLEMGKATIVFHIFLVILQIIILRKELKLKNLLQVLVVISLISCLACFAQAWFRRYWNGNRCALSRCEPWLYHEAVRRQARPSASSRHRTAPGLGLLQGV